MRKKRRSRSKDRRSRTPVDRSTRRDRTNRHRSRSKNIDNYVRDTVRCMKQSVETMSHSSQQEQTRFRDTRNPIIDFDPASTTQNICTWIQKIEAFREQYHWSELTTSTYMMEKLKGNPRKWYESLPSIAFSWQEWKEKFLAAFSDEIEFPIRMETALRRHKLHSETMSTYYFDKLALLTPCGLNEKWRIL